jgi:type I restriction enzyme S subunit
MSWDITPLSAFLTEREGRIKHTEANDLGLRRVTKIDFSGQIHLDQSTDTKTDMIRVCPGDLLISGINAAKGAISVHEDNEDVLATIHYSAYSYDPEQISVDFLKWFFKSPEFTDLLKQQVSGGIKTELKSKHILPLRLRLPKLREQESIAARLNGIQREQVKLEREIAHQEDLVAKLKQAILQEAITGRLTAGWRAAQTNVEPASQLLARIRAEKARLVAAKKLRPEKPLPPIPESEIPFAIPEGWEWCRLGQSGILKRGKSKHRPRNDERLFENGTVPFVQTGDVAQSKHTGFLIGTYSGQYNDFGVAQSQLWPAGTMCITIAANIAETGFLTIPACVPDSVVTYTSPAGADTPKYVRMFIELTRTMIEKFAPATAQKNINLEILNELMLPLPPLREQTEIVARVEGLMERSRELEAEIERSRVHAAALLQAVLREAFAPAAA